MVHAILFIIAVSLIFYVVLFFILLGFERVNTVLSHPDALTTGPEKRPPTSFRKIAFNTALVTFLFVLALVLMRISNSVTFDRMFKTAEVHKRSAVRPERAARQTAPATDAAAIRMPTELRLAAERPEMPPTLPPGTATPPDEEIPFFEEPDTGFAPATEDLGRFPLGTDGTNDYDTTRSALQAVALRTTGVKKGDIIICAFYDMLDGGKFYRSEGLRLSPAGKETGELVTIDIPAPGLRKGARIQLPFLMQGRIISAYLNDDALLLSPDGTLEALKDSPPARLSYLAHRLDRPTSASPTPDSTPWLEREYAAMPEEITALLRAVRTRPDEVRLSTVACIMNAYFGYQTGLRDIRLAEGTMWGDLLHTALRAEGRLVADCDVLATYAFICLRYLGYQPVLTVGYFNLNETGTTTLTAGLHTNLYLKAGGGFLFFEPTLFTRVITPAAPKTTSAGDGTRYAQPGAATRTTLSLPPTSRHADGAPRQGSLPEGALFKNASFFRPPAAVMKKFDEPALDTPPAARVSQAIADLVILTAPADTKRPMPSPAARALQFAVLTYLLALVFTKLFLAVAGRRERLIRLHPAIRLLFLAALSASAGALFLAASGMRLPSFAAAATVKMLAPFIGIAAAILSAASMLTSLFGMNDTAPHAKTVTFFAQRSFVATGAVLASAAALWLPNILTLAALCITIAALFTPLPLHQGTSSTTQ